MSERPEILSVRLLAQTRLFRIEELDLRFSNGEERRYERLAGIAGGAVLVVPVHEGQLYLVREYAAGTERYELGFPKGRIDPGESPEETANRELQEEIGLAAGRIEPLRAVTVAPGYFEHVTHLLLARDLRVSRLEGDEPEAVEVVRWPLADIDGLLGREDFTEARSLAALFLALQKLQRGDPDA
ncbi:MAG: ADP compounds hydrolase NudE [Gammaproteobacteria bacterium]|nr:MAG: ADP compounds hydrolase NudE [Gammaproteobacteria bacterium]